MCKLVAMEPVITKGDLNPFTISFLLSQTPHEVLHTTAVSMKLLSYNKGIYCPTGPPSWFHITEGGGRGEIRRLALGPSGLGHPPDLGETTLVYTYIHTYSK